MSKTIRVGDDTHASLKALKGEDDTFDDIISRLLEERREAIREGAGLWDGTDAAEKARKARKSMKESVGQ
jgi:predicted CopG family antitoxin